MGQKGFSAVGSLFPDRLLKGDRCTGTGVLDQLPELILYAVQGGVIVALETQYQQRCGIGRPDQTKSICKVNAQAIDIADFPLLKPGVRDQLVHKFEILSSL